jgi:hypothetical protein
MRLSVARFLGTEPKRDIPNFLASVIRSYETLFSYFVDNSNAS